MVLRSESSSEFNVFDAFIVSEEAADCLRVPHAGPILVLLPDATAAEALGSLDLGDLMSSTSPSETSENSDKSIEP